MKININFKPKLLNYMESTCKFTEPQIINLNETPEGTVIEVNYLDSQLFMDICRSDKQIPKLISTDNETNENEYELHLLHDCYVIIFTTCIDKKHDVIGYFEKLSIKEKWYEKINEIMAHLKEVFK